MIFNIYTYLFFSAMTAGAAMAVLIRTVQNPGRKVLWQISSIPFLIYLVMSFIIFIFGLVIVDLEGMSLKDALVFFLSALSLFTLSFYLIKALTFPLVLFLLLGTIFFFNFNLKGFSSFKDNRQFLIKTLLSENDENILEIKDFENNVDFVSVQKDLRYPLFLILDFSPYLFFLENPSYILHAGFIFELEDLDIQLADINENLKSSILPLNTIRHYKPPLIEEDVLSSVKLQLERSGTLQFYSKKLIK